MDVPLGPVRLGCRPPIRTGGQRRKEANALPQVFLAVSPEGMAIGAMLLVRAACVGQGGHLVALLGGVALLQDAQRIRGEDKQHAGVVFRLKPEVEARIRTSPAQSGGQLNTHFITHAAKVWRCWPVCTEDMIRFANGEVDFACMLNRGIYEV